MVIELFGEFGSEMAVRIGFQPFEFLHFVSCREEDPRAAMQLSLIHIPSPRDRQKSRMPSSA